VDDRPWGGPAAPAVSYVYAEGRSAREIREQLKDYAGLLQVDGYAAYKGLTSAHRKPGPVTLAFCMAHARRKFFDVHKTTGSKVCSDVLGQIGRVYAIEAEIHGSDAAARSLRDGRGRRRSSPSYAFGLRAN
jgi:transposase